MSISSARGRPDTTPPGPRPVPARGVTFDAGRPRNAASQRRHGYLTRDGVPPAALRSLEQHEVAPYPSVRLVEAESAAFVREKNGFQWVPLDSRAFASRVILLATGRIDVLPHLLGLREFYGRGVYQVTRTPREKVRIVNDQNRRPASAVTVHLRARRSRRRTRFRQASVGPVNPRPAGRPAS